MKNYTITKERSLEIGTALVNLLGGDKTIELIDTGLEHEYALVSAVFYEETSEGFKYIIYLPIGDLIPLETRGPHKTRVSDFLESNDIEETADTIAMFVILHELGHVDYMEAMDKNELLHVVEFVTEHNHRFSMIAIDDRHAQESKDEGVDIRYRLRPEEMFADAYAYREYVKAYKYLKQEGVL